MSLIAALLLASCAPPDPQVSPEGGNVPVKPVLYVRDGEWIEARAKGAGALAISEVRRWGAVRQVRVEAPEGAQFDLTVRTSAGDTRSVRFGPYHASVSLPPRPEPVALDSVRRVPGALVLTLRPAAAWLVEVNGGTTVLLPGTPYLGYLDCQPSTFEWAVPRATVRVAALDAAGRQGEFGPPVEVRAPPRFSAEFHEQVLDAAIEHGAWLALLVPLVGALVWLLLRTRTAPRAPAR